MKYLVLLLGGFALSVIHALIPNHWVPILSLAKTQGWNRSFTNLAAVIISISHSLSTILVGVFIGIIGLEVFKKYGDLSKILPSGIFVVMGLIFISLHIFDFSKHHHHHNNEFHLLHSHRIFLFTFLLFIFLGFAGAVYFLISFTKLQTILALVIAIIAVVSIAVVQITLQRKHKLYLYDYHKHDENDLSIHSHSHHNHINNHHHDYYGINLNKTTKWLSVLALSVSLFFSPCTEIEVYYIQMSVLGTWGIILLSLVYLLTTVGLTLTLVNIGEAIINKLKLDKLEHNEDLITGIVLLILSITFFIL